MSSHDYSWGEKTPRPGKLQLNKEARDWIRLKWGKIRSANKAADKAGNEWRLINESIEKYLDDSGETDIVQRTKIKSASIALKDALETGKWHSAESRRHIDDVQLFLRLKELEIL